MPPGRRSATRARRSARTVVDPPAPTLGTTSLPAVSTAASSEPTPQRLAAIRDQLKLIADYL